MNDDRVSDLAQLSIESSWPERINLECFVDVVEVNLYLPLY